MQTLFEVHGDHPISKRVDEYRLTESESNDLMAELKKFQYENIKRSSTPFLEVGDTVIITEQMYIDASDMAKEQINYMFDVGINLSEFPIKGNLKSERVNRSAGHLVVEWEKMSDDWGAGNTTNNYWLSEKDHGFGFNFIQPEFEELSIIDCDDEFLFEEELVIKYYALQNKISEAGAISFIKMVESAMEKSGIIFYRP